MNDSAGLVAGLRKYSGRKIRQRASSPKLQVMNTALMTASSGLAFKDARGDSQHWGRLVESAIGASLANSLAGSQAELFYWSGRNREVDFVIARGTAVVAIEVKSGRRRTSLPGMDAFAGNFKVAKKLLVGTGGIGIEEFLAKAPLAWLD